METTPTNGNGASRVGLYATTALAFIAVISIMGSMFYVAFTSKANTDAIVDQRVFNAATTTALTALQIKLNAIEISQNETETQFCAQDIVRNLMHANDMRGVSILWEKAGLGRMPTDNAYYPTICNRRTK